MWSFFMWKGGRTERGGEVASAEMTERVRKGRERRRGGSGEDRGKEGEGGTETHTHGGRERADRERKRDTEREDESSLCLPVNLVAKKEREDIRVRNSTHN